ncbi:lysylphosphatidylglycerol synthase domain-containing protein [Nitratireductor basaltis]|uniref:Putative integral membrane protein n=1 Tax=Nitratireductor basaltis TaxID=472175 RepID=A0A084UAU7_9HYPH|nr:lysylphosphatidylglycerol synthase domain-containing protein [Nitratireductor basaltis]KFB10083.1 putative integral membrane protein [Nitratireductor basaltis]
MAIKKHLLRLFVFAAICLAGYLLYRTLSKYSFSELKGSLFSISAWHLAGAIGFAACSYFCLTFFDYLGLRYAGRPMPYPKVAYASFTSLSIGHNIGVAALSGGAVRYRFYSKWGASGGEVANVILFSGVTVLLGLITLAGTALLLRPQAASEMTMLGVTTIRILAIGGLCVPLAYIGIAAFYSDFTWRFKHWEFRIPQMKLAIAQIAVGLVNFAFVAACLHQTVLAFADVGYIDVAAVYAIANGTALISHVPGGLGVLEATVLYLLRGAPLVGAVLAFRFCYFLLPLMIGLPMLLLAEGGILRKTDRDKKEQASASRA